MYKHIIQNLLKGDASDLTLDVIHNINQITLRLLYKEPLEPFEVDIVGDILHISNIIYNNTDRSVLVLEDGIYDMLMVKYKRYNPNYQVGAEPVHFEALNVQEHSTNDVPKAINPFVKLDYDVSSMLFYDQINIRNPFRRPMPLDYVSKVTKRLRTVSHEYPALVGTLDKAKFTLAQEAESRGCEGDPNTVVFERDFLAKHIGKGIVDISNVELVLELKYDGVSIEAEVTDRIVSARTRGDTGNDKATDLTPVLEGYPFFDAMRYAQERGLKIEKFGMKFEAIIDNFSLQELERLYGIRYASPRNAVIGLLSRSDARQFAHYITLVPLQTSLEGMNRIEEIEFMNRFYANGIRMAYSVVHGYHRDVLYQVYRFVTEAEILRSTLPFKYDGVVVSYLDPRIREELGRKNHVNQYSIAIKFNTNKKYTRFIGYTFTVGKDGTITPLIHFEPVEFFGGIHTKSSGHSYARFVNLGLRKGDIVEAEFRNDVMVYIDKVASPENSYNPNPVIPFPNVCPECGQPIRLSESGETALCINPECPGRRIARVTDMVAKLGFKGIGEQSVRDLNLLSLTDLMNISDERCYLLGEANGEKLIEAINKFKVTPIPDYIVLGSLGFTNLANAKWQNILKKISLEAIINDDDVTLNVKLMSAKLGPKTSQTVYMERHMFMNDLITVSNLPNIVKTGAGTDKVVKNKKTIRFTGFRDNDLMFNLNFHGHDVSDGSVTKKTDYLLVPYFGYQSSKVAKALELNKAGANIVIVPITEFRAKLDSYIP